MASKARRITIRLTKELWLYIEHRQDEEPDKSLNEIINDIIREASAGVTKGENK